MILTKSESAFCLSKNISIDIDELEKEMLEIGQAECPVAHYFGPNIYIREVFLKAGTFAIGHKQKHEHLNVMLTGSVAILKDDGTVDVLKAPLIYVGKPGRKVGYVIEDCRWQNIYSTNETDIEKLESMFVEKSEAWIKYKEKTNALENSSHSIDRDDFSNFLKEINVSEAIVREQSENTLDQIEMPEPFKSSFVIKKSSIEGLGVFITYKALSGSLIAPARLNGKRTPIGRYTNHSKNPNAIFIKDENNDIWLVLKKDVNGCSGGDDGTEITVDYRQAISLSYNDFLEN